MTAGISLDLPTDHDKGIHAQAGRQLVLFVKLDKRFEDFPVDALGRLFGTDVFLAEHLAASHDAAPELPVTVGLRRYERTLTNLDFSDVGFVDVNPNAEACGITEGNDGCIRRKNRAFSSFQVPSENNAVDG